MRISLPKITDDERKRLARAGMPGYLYRANPYELDDRVRRFQLHREDMRPKGWSKRTQLDHCRAIWQASEPFVACVSSSPNDLRAKQFAAYSMLRWLRARRHRDKTIRWHTLLGGFSDRLLDEHGNRMKRKPEMLVIANLATDSSSVKREKLRDLLEVFSDVPRLLAVTGSDPVSFMNNVGCHVQHVVWIRPLGEWEV